jgi:hypothetical protein
MTIERAAVLNLSIDIKPGILPWIRSGMHFSTEVPLDVSFDRPLLPQIQEAFRRSLNRIRMRLVDHRAPPPRKVWKN